MSKGGRPRIVINWDEFDKLVSYQCTQVEIADWFNCSVDTLEDACKRDRGVSLADIWDKKKNFGRVKIKKRQFEIADSTRLDAGTMAIYLGKVYLGQTDKPPEPPLPTTTDPLKAILRKKTFEEYCEAAGYPKPYPKQVEMSTFCLEGEEPRLLLGSRGYGKTDYGPINSIGYDVYSAWWDGKTTSNLVVTKTKTRGSAIITEIARGLECNGVPLDKSNSTVIRIQGHSKKDHSVEAISIGTSFRGRHPYRIWFDDPVTEEDVSAAMRKLVLRKYSEAYKLCKNIVIIGQPAHHDDLYALLRPIIKVMEVPYGSIPELDPDLDAMRLAGIDENSIKMSYFLEVPKEGSDVFANLRFIDKFPNGDSVAFIDPSDGGDYTAMSVLKGYGEGIAAIGFCWKKAWYHCLDEIVPILKARGVRKLCFETNSTGTQPIEQLRVLLAPMGIGVVGKHSDTNKHACIVSAGSFSHLIHLSKESHKTYTDHVTKYEYKAEFDDAPDSLARGLEWLGLIRGKK